MDGTYDQFVIVVIVAILVLTYVFGRMYFENVDQREEVVFWKGQYKTLEKAFEAQTSIMKSLFDELQKQDIHVTLTYGEDRAEVDLTGLYRDLSRKEEEDGEVECDPEQ